MGREFIVHALAYIAVSAIVFAVGWALRMLTRSKSDARLCPRCLYNVESLAGLGRCPECGLDLHHSGVIAPGTRMRKRIPFFTVCFSILWLFGALWLIVNAFLNRANVLQSEERTYQVQLVCDDPNLAIGAGWWRRSAPLRDPVEFVQFQPMRVGGRLVQWYDQGKPSRWEREGVTSASGTGEVPIDEVWTLLSQASLDPNDPIAIARVNGLREVLLAGPNLNPPAGSPWRDVQPFGPIVDRDSSLLAIVSTATILLALWAMTCVIVASFRRKRFPIVARRIPLPVVPVPAVDRQT